MVTGPNGCKNHGRGTSASARWAKAAFAILGGGTITTGVVLVLVGSLVTPGDEEGPAPEPHAAWDALAVLLHVGRLLTGE